MESEINNEVSQEELTQNSFNTVTSLSKYLAMALFVILPFVGGWVGYMYAPEKIVELEKIVIKEVRIEASDSDYEDAEPKISQDNDYAPCYQTEKYINDEYGFSLDYPTCEEYGARQNSIESGGSFQIWEVTHQEDVNPANDWTPINSVFIGVTNNPSGLSVTEFYNGTHPANLDLVGQTMDEDRETIILDSGLVVEYFNPYMGLTGAEQNYIVDTNQGYFIEVFDRNIVFTREEIMKILNSIEI